jgi:hypothetical protein
MQNIKEYLSYNPLTGEFTWIKRLKTSHVIVGGVAGTINSFGYIHIQYNNKKYLAHRLAWYFIYGEMPDCDIDHANEIKTDNRLTNLRLDTERENQQNISKPNKRNTSGFTGVSWHKNDKLWRAQIRVSGKYIYLGEHPSLELAHEAYLAAKREHHTFWREIK